MALYSGIEITDFSLKADPVDRHQLVGTPATRANSHRQSWFGVPGGLAGLRRCQSNYSIRHD